MNCILFEIEIPFTKYRLTQTQVFLMRVFSNTKKSTKVISNQNEIHLLKIVLANRKHSISGRVLDPPHHAFKL